MSNTLLPLFTATTAYTSACTDAGAALAPLLSGGTRVRHCQSARDYGQIRGAFSFPWMIAVDYCASVQCRIAFNRRNRSIMTLPGWGQKVLLHVLAIITVPLLRKS